MEHRPIARVNNMPAWELRFWIKHTTRAMLDGGRHPVHAKLHYACILELERRKLPIDSDDSD